MRVLIIAVLVLTGCKSGDEDKKKLKALEKDVAALKEEVRELKERVTENSVKDEACADVAGHVARVAEWSETRRKELAAHCENLEFAGPDKKCLLDAKKPEAVSKCLEKIQSFPQALELFCSAPSKSGANEMAEAENRWVIMMAWAADRIVNSRMRVEFSALIAKEGEAKRKHLEGLTKKAGLASCEMLSQID